MPDVLATVLSRIYEHVKSGKTHSAMDVLLAYVDLAFDEGRFDDVDRLLVTADLDRLSPTLQIGLLAFTRVASERLSSRLECAERIRVHLEKTDASLVDRVLARVL